MNEEEKKNLLEILVVMQNEIESLCVLIEPLEDQVQKCYEIRSKLTDLGYMFGID